MRAGGSIRQLMRLPSGGRIALRHPGMRSGTLSLPSGRQRTSAPAHQHTSTPAHQRKIIQNYFYVNVNINLSRACFPLVAFSPVPVLPKARHPVRNRAMAGRCVAPQLPPPLTRKEAIIAASTASRPKQSHGRSLRHPSATFLRSTGKEAIIAAFAITDVANRTEGMGPASFPPVHGKAIACGRCLPPVIPEAKAKRRLSGSIEQRRRAQGLR